MADKPSHVVSRRDELFVVTGEAQVLLRLEAQREEAAEFSVKLRPQADMLTCDGGADAYADDHRFPLADPPNVKSLVIWLFRTGSGRRRDAGTPSCYTVVTLVVPLLLVTCYWQLFAPSWLASTHILPPPTSLRRAGSASARWIFHRVVNEAADQFPP